MSTLEVFPIDGGNAYFLIAIEVLPQPVLATDMAVS